MKATKKHDKDNKIWESWKNAFQGHGLENVRLRKQFRRFFTLDVEIVNDLFDDEEFLMHIKKNRILSKENTFLAFLYKCKTGFI